MRSPSLALRRPGVTAAVPAAEHATARIDASGSRRASLARWCTRRSWHGGGRHGGDDDVVHLPHELFASVDPVRLQLAPDQKRSLPGDVVEVTAGRALPGLACIHRERDRDLIDAAADDGVPVSVRDRREGPGTT